MHVLVIDDHPLYRQALSAHVPALAGSVTMLEAASCAQAFAMLPPQQGVDLILLDIALAEENGLDQMRSLRQRFPAAPIVVISASENADQVRAAIARGAEGYVPKSANAEVIRAALQIVMNGGTYMPTFALPGQRDAGAAGGPAEHAAAGSGELLTARQMEILVCLAKGWSNKQIANELGVAVSTVRTHVTQILNALNASNRTAACHAAYMRGLLKQP